MPFDLSAEPRRRKHCPHESRLRWSPKATFFPFQAAGVFLAPTRSQDNTVPLRRFSASKPCCLRDHFASLE